MARNIDMKYENLFRKLELVQRRHHSMCELWYCSRTLMISLLLGYDDSGFIPMKCDCESKTADIDYAEVLSVRQEIKS